jgi:uncharacterized protein with PIN domain
VPAATFRFYAELNDFLAPNQRGAELRAVAKGPVSVKHMIEALGVPHTEAALVLANGKRVDFNYPVQDGDRFSVYPVFRTLAGVTDLPHKPGRFVLDGHLGKLAAYLRMLGFDVCYRNHIDDDELAAISEREERILLTRDQGLLKRSIVAHGYWVRAKLPRQQVVEVLHRFNLFERIAPLTVCLDCNGRLKPVEKEAVIHRLEPLTKKYFDTFKACAECGKIYWPGSHYERMMRFIEEIRKGRV